jgi:diguanylate cyclase (GGDEF)-like protein
MNECDSRVLVVDDEETIRSVIAQVLEEDGYHVTEAGSGEEALDVFRRTAFPLVITDIVMSRMSGIELLKELKLLDPEVQVVVITSHASVDTATSALRSGATDYLTKPFDDLNAISKTADMALERRKLSEHNRQLMDRLKQNAEELKDLNRRLHEQATRDGLTGLFNHRYFRESLATELARCSRYRRPFSLVFMDVDHFKRYNDTHGHLAGDDLLKNLARLLEQDRRGSTIVCRYGGEEFVMLVPETDREGALKLAEIVRQRIEAHPFSGEERQPLGRVTLSLGVASYPDDGEDAEILIQHADKALYAAKNAGRNAVR